MCHAVGNASLERAEDQWHEVHVQFDHWYTAERAAVTYLAPQLNEAIENKLISTWFFVRKGTCWRVRYLPERGKSGDSAVYVIEILASMLKRGHAARWIEAIYEPEAHAFGGPAAMDVAHELFGQDSRHIIDYIASDRKQPDQRRELSLLLCMHMMRSAGQDWYEQGDIWAQVASHRTTDPLASCDGPTPALRSALHQFMTVDTSPDGKLGRGNLGFASAWLGAFEQAGRRLSDLKLGGNLTRGLRAILAHHVLFHWNRLGLPYRAQTLIATAARDVVFGTPDQPHL